MTSKDAHGIDRKEDLDGLRGVAVLMTILLHYIFRSGIFHYLGPPHVASLLDSLWAGVDIFFVLSGFLVGGIIIDHGHAATFVRVFYQRRALRILPVALLTIAFAYLVVPSIHFRNQVPPYAYLLFINNLWTAFGHPPYSPLGPMWSLAIEAQFYLFAPALLRAVGPRARNTALLATIVVSPLLRATHLGPAPWDFTLFRLDGFAAGMLVAAWVRDARYREFAARNRRPVNLILVGLVSAALVFASSPQYSDQQRIIIGVSLNSLAAAAIIVWLQLNPAGRLSSTLSQTWLVTLGRFSYFLYLMHVPMLILTNAMHHGGIKVLNPLLAFSVTLLGAWASWRLLESPLIQLGKRYLYTQNDRAQPMCDTTPSLDYSLHSPILRDRAQFTGDQT